MICSISDCTRTDITGWGWCGMHYKRWYKYGDPTTPPKVGRTGQEYKATLKASISPSSKDIYWAAGFLEGEGSFRLARGTVITAPQVQREPLDRLQKMFGGTIAFRKRENPKHSDIHIWSVCGSRARGVMMTLYSIMSPRRQEQIRKSLAQ